MNRNKLLTLLLTTFLLLLSAACEPPEEEYSDNNDAPSENNDAPSENNDAPSENNDAPSDDNNASGDQSCGGLRANGEIATCGDGEYCHYLLSDTCGWADATGTCQTIPELCDASYNPVCGCDGQTYGNECDANANGTSIVSKGACDAEPEERLCGTRGAPSCLDGEYCHYEPQAICGASDLPGTCQTLPEACDANYDPVCGCDDQTYGNACEANANGVSVVHLGECADPNPTDPVQCGARLGDTCGRGEYCHFELRDICGWADATGTCQTLPEVCTEQYDPVCGCDGQTYGNECEANAAGASVAAWGACEDDPQDGVRYCGGLSPNGEERTCERGEYCHYNPEDICGWADAPGTCQTIPEFCTEQHEPVCGCDGRNYGNACEAASNSVGVLHSGLCEE